MDIESIGDWLCAGWETEEENEYSPWQVRTETIVRKDVRRGIEHQSEVTRIVHKNTGDRYLYQRPTVVALKSLALLNIIPFYSLASIGANVLRIPSQIIYEIGSTGFSVLKNLVCLSPLSSVEAIGKGINEMIVKVSNLVYEISRTPFYTLYAMFAAFYGAISPYNGRALFAKVENQWNHGNTMSKDWARNTIIQRDFTIFLKDCFGVQKGGVFYLAQCFQPRLQKR